MRVDRSLKVGLALGMYDVETGRTVTLAELAAQADEAEQLGYDSIWLMDHMWLDDHAAGERSAGLEPIVTAAYLAARSNLTIGFLVLSNPFRHVGQLARELWTLQQALPGRLIVGISAGWGTEEYSAFDFPADRRVSRFEETLATLAPLLRGEKVDFDGEFVKLAGAHLVTDGPAPPVWAAAFKPRMQRITVRHADGWQTAWHGHDTSRFLDEHERITGFLHEESRPAEDLEISVGIRMLPLDGDELEAASARAERLKPAGDPEWWATPVREKMATGTVDELATVVETYRDLGAKHVILNLSVSPFALFDRSFPARAAKILDRVRGTAAGVASGPRSHGR